LQLNVDPAPTNVFADALVKLIAPVPVPAVVVNPDAEPLLNAVALDDAIAKVPPLNVIFLVPAAVRNVAVAVADSVKVLPFKLSVPFVRVNTPATALEIVQASLSVSVPPKLLRISCWVNVTPLLVIDCDPRFANVSAAVPLRVVPVPLSQLPYKLLA
jgi:hypothetical protein